MTRKTEHPEQPNNVRSVYERTADAMIDIAVSRAVEKLFPGELEKLRAEIERLREALKPFAVSDEAIERWFGVEDAENDGRVLFSAKGYNIETRHLRAARSALKGGTE